MGQGKLSDELGERVWRALPPDVLLTVFSGALESGEGIAWAWLSPAAWDAILGWWRANPTETLHGLDYIPEEQAGRLIAARLGGMEPASTWRTLWERFPALCREAAYDELTGPPQQPPRDGVAWALPEEELAVLVERIAAGVDVLSTDEFVCLHLLRWAHFQAAARGPDWRSAFGLMSRLAAGQVPKRQETLG